MVGHKADMVEWVSNRITEITTTTTTVTGIKAHKVITDMEVMAVAITVEETMVALHKVAHLRVVTMQVQLHLVEWVVDKTRHKSQFQMIWLGQLLAKVEREFDQ